MNNQRQNFLRALSILNSLLIAVFILFWIDRINLSFLLKFGFIFIPLMIGSLKIYFMSGISGCILEILHADETLFSMRRIHQNAKNLWQGFLIVFVIIQCLDFLLFVLFPALRIGRNLYFTLLGTIATYVLARWTINKKYVKPLKIPARKLKFNLNFILVMIAACVLELVLVKLSDFVHTRDFLSASVLTFMLNYIYVFVFIFCALAILDNYPEITEDFSRQKEIFLINPMAAGIAHCVLDWLTHPYSPVFVVLKALTPKTYKFREFNQVLWHKHYYKNDVFVCITCFTSNCHEAYKIAKEFKKRGSTVVMGGPHVTFLPAEALTFCDSVVVGQAEGVWRDVIRDYENGRLQPQYSGPATEADYAQVQQELLNSPPSIIKDFLETTRGCKFRCHFCTIPSLCGGEPRTVPINDIIELIKKIKPYYHSIGFIDNNIYANPGYAKELFLALKPLKIKWQSYCSIDIAQNRETLKLAGESGCTGLTFGYETSGESLEKNQGGKFALAQKYLEYTKIIKKAGIEIKGHFIFGFDSDNLKTLLALWKFCFSLMLHFSVISLLTPLPGSRLYRDMLIQNRIINLNWRNYAVNKLVLSHPQMNSRLVSFLFPLIQTLFNLTASISGLLMLLLVCCSVTLWIEASSFYKIP